MSEWYDLLQFDDEGAEEKIKRLTKERDEAREAFMVTYDELEDFHCSWCSRQSAMPKEVEPFAGLYERLKREASGET